VKWNAADSNKIVIKMVWEQFVVMKVYEFTY